MKNIRNTAALLLFVSVLLCFLCGCSGETQNDVTAHFSDEYGIWEGEEATLISLSEYDAQISGGGVELQNGVLTIVEKGTYVLSGKYKGQIAVNADKCKINLVLNGVSIECEYSCPIYIMDAKKVTVTLAQGTTNYLTDSEYYILDEGDEPNATLFSRADLVFEGEGKLVVNANYNNAIRSKDTLEICSGEYIINSVSSGISGKDSLKVSGGSFDIICAGDALKSTDNDDSSVGWVSISGGTFSIESGNDAIQAESKLSISGGEFNIVSGGSSDRSSESMKGLKAGSDIEISGGTISLDCDDDAIHSNGNVTISNGELTIASGDDAIHADDSLSILGGRINITKSCEGLEGVGINISGGDVDIVSSDDGMNSAGGNDSSGFDGRGGRDMFAADSDCSITISGGSVFIDAAGDGIDSNGNVYINGGVTIVNGPTNDANGALDYSGECIVTGGILLASGSSGMAQNISNGSSQASLKITFSGTVPAGTLIGILDSDGELVAAYAPTKNFSSFVYSSPELVEGDEYTITAEGYCSGTETDGLYTEGELSGYQELGTMELTAPATNHHGMGRRGGAVQ